LTQSRLLTFERPKATRKSKKAVTVDILAILLQAWAGVRLVDLRDRALLLTAFASGRRQRSEIAGLQVADLVDEVSVRDDPNDANSASLPAARNRQAGSALGSAAKVVHLKTTKMYPNLSFNPSVPDVKLLPVAWRRQFHGERRWRAHPDTFHLRK